MGEARILLREAPVAGSAAEVERKLSVLELLWNDGFVRKTVIILFLAAVWEAYGLTLDNPLLFPTLHDTILRSTIASRTARFPCGHGLR
jgi:NitT/TauT family transport system permease protein